MNFEEKGRSYLDHTPDMVYNGIAYGIKRLFQRDLLELMALTKPMRQDADTS